MSKVVNDNLYEARNNVLKEICILNYEDFNRRPNVNNWSIAQVCHHLILVEKATAYVIDIELKTNNSAKLEQKNVHILLDRTKKIKAPKIVEPNEGPFEVQQIIDWLNDSRSKLNSLLSRVEDKSILERKSVKHPSLGDLPLNQWIEQIYLHEQRHIEQIKEVKRFIGIKN